MHKREGVSSRAILFAHKTSGTKKSMSSGGLEGSKPAPKAKKGHLKKKPCGDGGGDGHGEHGHGEHGHGGHGHDEDENDDDFNAILIKEDMVNKFGRDPEDIHLSTMHPLGCMHGDGKRKVTEYEETWATRMVGGLGVIEEQIEKIAKSTDDIDTRLNVDEAGKLLIEMIVCLMVSLVCFR